MGKPPIISGAAVLLLCSDIPFVLSAQLAPGSASRPQYVAALRRRSLITPVEPIHKPLARNQYASPDGITGKERRILVAQPLLRHLPKPKFTDAAPGRGLRDIPPATTRSQTAVSGSHVLPFPRCFLRFPHRALRRFHLTPRYCSCMLKFCRLDPGLRCKFS